jgi:hypothetical protein
VQHHGLAAGTDTRGPDRRGTPLQQMISHRGGCRAQGDTHTSTGKRIHQAGKVCRERRHFVPSLHILSDHRWGDATRAIVPCPKRISITHDLLCTWSVHGTLPIVSGPFLLRKSGHPPPTYEILDRRLGSTGESVGGARPPPHLPPTPAALGARPPEHAPAGGLDNRWASRGGQDIYLVYLRIGWSIYIFLNIFLTVGVVHTSPPEDGSLAPVTTEAVADTPRDRPGSTPGPAKTAEGDCAKKDRRGPSHVIRPAGAPPPLVRPEALAPRGALKP